jgi:thioredoxin 1
MSAAIEQITEGDFQREVFERGVPVVVDFWAPWCGPCRMMAPELDKVAASLGERAKVIKVNVDEQPALASRYNVAGIPTLVIFHHGKEVGRHVGLVSAAVLAASVERHLPTA